MDPNLPVDIKLSSLMDWLQTRRYVKHDWAQKVKDIRAKIAEAIQDMPENEDIKNLLSNTYINYFHCLKIVDILKETEKDTQNFFGHYSSQRMKDWKAIVSMYQKDKVYIAEAAHYLNQMVKYDIPGLKRELTALEKKITEKEDKEKNHKRLTTESGRIYDEELRRRELKGNNLRVELMEKTKFIPTQAKEMGNLILGLREAVQLFTDFQKSASSSYKEMLPLLKFIQERGPEVTVYEWKYKVAPNSCERTDYEQLCRALNNADEKSEDEIDFGDVDDISFDITVEGDGEINFDVEDENPSVAVVADENTAPGIALGQEALTVLENKITRLQCQRELNLLKMFLTMRSRDAGKEHPADMLIHGFMKSPSDVNGDASHVEKWDEAIKKILNEFNNADMATLFEIFHDPSSMAGLVDQLTAMENKIDFHKRSADLVRADQKELREAMAAKIGDVKQVVANAKVLEGQLQTELKQFTSGRPVNFMGGVKSIDSLFTNYSL